MDCRCEARGSRLLDLVDVMDRLRQECPWDQQQSHESLVRYLVEETYETIEAIESGDRKHLREELGDLLLQVVFHARIASEQLDEGFDIDDVAGGIVEKLIRRHPHVFAGTPSGADGAEASDAETSERLSAHDVASRWETLKAREKGRASAVDGIPLGLPALSLADKVITRVRRSGPQQASVSTSSTSGTAESPYTAQPPYTAESLGEVLFGLVAAASAAGLDAEQALRHRVAREMAQVRAADQLSRCSED